MGLKCTVCPRKCGVERGVGFCGAPESLEVSAVCLHQGEEPPLVGGNGTNRGIINIFFSHCNLQCVYCQNHIISGRNISSAVIHYTSVDAVVEQVARLLPQSCGLVGFVSAAHYADYIPLIIDALHAKGLTPTFVYNSGGYESLETLHKLEGKIDIYLPDLKYMRADLAQAYSHAVDYPNVAKAALLEMKRQVGGGLKSDTDGVAYRGIIVRHLVLPGAVDNSLRCLDWLADEFNPFTLHLSLMSQYYPPVEGLPEPLNRVITPEEYTTVTEYADTLGFCCGWRQELESQQSYRPDFTNADNPFVS